MDFHAKNQKQNSRQQQGEMPKKKNMRVFAFLFNSKDRIAAIRKLRDHGTDVVYWNGCKVNFEEVTKDKKNFPNTVFHNSFDAMEGIPPLGIDSASFPPVGQELAERLLKCESQALVLFNAIDLTGVPLIKKKHRYYTHVRFWLGMFSMLKPDALLFGDIPHSTYQFVAYCMAKMFGIKTVMFRNVQIPGRLLFFDDFEDYSRIREEIKKTQDKDFKIEDLSPDVREFYQKQRNPAEDSTIFYMKKDFMRVFSTPYPFPRFQSILKNLKDGTFFKALLGYIRMFLKKRRIESIERFEHFGIFIKLKAIGWSRTKRKFAREYLNALSVADFSKKFVYVPLHNQPECSTNPMGDIFVDQILMVDILAHSLPKEWVLYVKESPLQFVGPRTQNGRYKGYYKELASIPNVRLVSQEVSTFDLMNKAEAVATVTSTAGWEALLREKPVILFGRTWYMYCDGVFKVSDVESVRTAFKKIKNGYKPDRQKILNFLAVIDRVSVRGFLNARFKNRQNIKITSEENAETLARSLYRELTRTSVETK